MFLLIAPLLNGPPPLFALGFFLLRVPVYFFLVMTSPWKIHPKFMDIIGGKQRAHTYIFIVSSGLVSLMVAGERDSLARYVI